MTKAETKAERSERVQGLHTAVVAARKAFDDYKGEEGEAEYEAWKRAVYLYERELD